METDQRRSRRGFTLVEILVVMGVTAVLVSLLIPALRSARDASRRSGCASNLRQLALANLAYANENSGSLAPGAARFDRNLDRWFGVRLSTRDPFEPRGGPLSPLLGPEGAVRQCPAFRPAAREATDFEAGCGGYGYNNAYLGVERDGGDQAGIGASAVKRPDETAMFADTAMAMPVPILRFIEYSFAEPPLARHTGGQLDASLHFRHADAANVAWVDGHAASREFSFTRSTIYGVTESQMRELHLGWFGPETNRFFDLQ